MIVSDSEDMVDVVKEKSEQAVRRNQRAAIVQAGAIGDCILTLPLAAYMKESLGLGAVDMIGHTEYIGMLPERSCIDGVRSIDTLGVHRLFAKAGQFNLTDGDPLITAFSDYSWVVTFLGEPDSDFEQNLIFTTNCSHSGEVVTLALKPAVPSSEHISDFYVRQFMERCEMPLDGAKGAGAVGAIRAGKSDFARGGELLHGLGVDSADGPVVMAPGSGAMEKCWHAENFLSIGRKLQSEGMSVVFVLGPAELERFDGRLIEMISETAPCLRDVGLVDVVGLLSRASAFVGNDSGLTHLAGCMGIRTLAMFGPTDPAIYQPKGSQVLVLHDKSDAFSSSANDEISAMVAAEVLKSS